MNKFLNDFFNLNGKTVLITGASGQLGTKITEAYVSVGCKVIGMDLIKPSGDYAGIDFYEGNIAVKKDIENVMSTVFEKYKGVDILINNAGVSTFEPFEERPEEKIDLVMDINLKGTFLCIQSYVAEIDKYKKISGSIINIASFYGVISPDFRIYTDCDRKNSEIYGATKAGIIQMTKYFAVHLAERNIRVNAISPGGIFNPTSPQGADFIKNYSFRCPMKRMADANEMIGGILYLSSSAASYTTGQNIIIDGGMSSW
jgi:NAD(P)-dependent dehydrogenase (short-subunit alcohol dehydrogenase family)